MAHYPYNDLRLECTITNSGNSNEFVAKEWVTPAVPVAAWEGTKEPMLTGLAFPKPTNLRYANITNHVYSPTRNTAYYYNNQVIQYSSVLSPIRLVYILKITDFIMTSCTVGCLHPDGVIFLCNNNTSSSRAILVKEISEEPFADYETIHNYPGALPDTNGNRRLHFVHYYDNKFYAQNGVVYDMNYNEIATHLVDNTAKVAPVNPKLQPNRWWIGTATANGGTKSCYISNNDSANSYTNSLSVSHFYRDVEINSTTTDPASISFNWKGVGDTTWGYLQFRVIETSETPVPGTLPSGSSLVGNLFNSSVWINRVVTLGEMSGVKRIVFTWRNTANTTYQPPAAVDNIIIKTNVGPDIIEDFESGDGTTLDNWVFPDPLVILPPNISYYGFNTERDILYGYNANLLNTNNGDGKFLCNIRINNTGNLILAVYDVVSNNVKVLNSIVTNNISYFGYYFANNCVVVLMHDILDSQTPRMAKVKIYDLISDNITELDIKRSTTFTTFYVRPTFDKRYVNIATNLTVATTPRIYETYFTFVDTIDKRIITRNGSYSYNNNSGSNDTALSFHMTYAYAFIEYEGEFVGIHTKLSDGNALHSLCDVPVVLGDRIYSYGHTSANHPVYFVDKTNQLTLLSTNDNTYQELNPTTTPVWFLPTSNLVYLQYNNNIYKIGISNFYVGTNNYSVSLVVSVYDVASYSWSVVNKLNLSSGNNNSDFRIIRACFDEDYVYLLVNYANSTALRIIIFNKITYELISNTDAQRNQPFYISFNNTQTALWNFSSRYGNGSSNLRPTISTSNMFYNNFYLFFDISYTPVPFMIYDMKTRIIHQMMWDGCNSTTSGLSIPSNTASNYTITFVELDNNKILASAFFNNNFSLILEHDLSTRSTILLNHSNWNDSTMGRERKLVLGNIYRVADRIYINTTATTGGVAFDLDYNPVSFSGITPTQDYSDYYRLNYNNITPHYFVNSDNTIIKDNDVITVTNIDSGYVLRTHLYVDGMSCVLCGRTNDKPRLYLLNEDFSVTFLREYNESSISHTSNNNIINRNVWNIGKNVLYSGRIPNTLPLKRIPSNVSSMSYINPMRNHDSFYLVSFANGGIMKQTGPTTFTLTTAPVEYTYSAFGISTNTILLRGRYAGTSNDLWYKWDEFNTPAWVQCGGTNPSSPTLVTQNTCTDRIYIMNSSQIFKYDRNTNTINLFQTLGGFIATDLYIQHKDHKEGRMYFVRNNILYRESDDLLSIVEVLRSETNIVNVIICPGDLLYYANTRDVFSFNGVTQNRIGTTGSTTNIVDIAIDGDGVIWGITGSTTFNIKNGVISESITMCRYITVSSQTNQRELSATYGALTRLIIEPEHNRRFMFNTNYQFYWSDLYNINITRTQRTIDTGRIRLFLYNNYIFSISDTEVVVWFVDVYGNLVSSEFDWQMGNDKRHLVCYKPFAVGADTHIWDNPNPSGVIENMHTSDITDVITDQYSGWMQIAGNWESFNAIVPRKSNEYSYNSRPRFWDQNIKINNMEVASRVSIWTGTESIYLPLNIIAVTNKLVGSGNDLRISLTVKGSGYMYLSWGVDSPIQVELTGSEQTFDYQYTAKNFHTITIYANDVTYFKCTKAKLMQVDISKNKTLTRIDVQDNLLWEYELNHIIEHLPPVTGGTIKICDNPASDTCDRFSVIEKGWDFDAYQDNIDITEVNNSIVNIYDTHGDIDDNENNVKTIEQARASVMRILATTYPVDFNDVKPTLEDIAFVPAGGGVNGYYDFYMKLNKCEGAEQIVGPLRLDIWAV